MKHRCFLVTGLVLLLATVGAGLHAGGSTEGREIVAVVNGVAIPHSFWEREMMRFEDMLRRQGQPVDEARRREVSIQALDTLIDMELLYQESRRREIEVSEGQISEQVQGLRGRFPSDEAFSAGLEQMGFEPGELDIELERQLAVQLLIDTHLAPDITVTQEELREYYAAHPELFRTSEQVRARHILILVGPDAPAEEADRALNTIQELRRRIVGGEAFAEVAREFSEDASAAEGGDLGYFSKERMVPGFSEAAFSLPLETVSEPVRSEYGYHLIEVTERIEEGTMAYEDVESELRRFLHHERTMGALDRLVAGLRETASIEKYPARAPAQ